MVNFQLNRWHSSGAARFDDLVEIGRKIHNFGDWKNELIRIAETAEYESRLLNAATYFRAAEFVAAQGDPKKEELYVLHEGKKKGVIVLHGCYVFGAGDLYSYVMAQKQYNTKDISRS